MKIVLLDSTKPFYKANLHCHSTKSDGKMTVEELKERYMSQGYSIIAYTDHEHLIDNSHLNDEHFLAITSCELAIKQFEHEHTGVRRDMKVCHLNFYAKEPHNIDTPCYSTAYDHFIKEDSDDPIVHSCGEYQRVYSHAGISEMIRIAGENGFLVTYNHPRWSLENARDYLGYEGLWAVEIYNHACFHSGHWEYDIHAYDDFLRDGHRMACVAADDNHALSSTCGGYVMINADSLDYVAVIDAMEHRRLYASTGPVIQSLFVEDGVAHLTFEKGAYATVTTKGRRVQKIMAENPDGENTVSFVIQPDDGYVRFDVVDAHNRRANTCAYFLDEIGM